MRYVREFFAAPRRLLAAKAIVIRDDWERHVAAWERDTEPGYPLPAITRQRRELGLAVANLYDTLAHPRRA